MERHEIARASDVPAGGAKMVRVLGVELGIFRVGDEYHAYRNLCPHAAAPVCGGKVTDGILRCPWHGWEFDLLSGAGLTNRTSKLESYSVEVEDGRLFVLA